MAIKASTLGASSAGGEDFTVNIGTNGYTKSDLGKNFGSGNYICTSSLSDSTLDIYFLNEDGTVSGYVNSAAATSTIIASKSFRYIVIYGFTSNDTLTFQYKTVVSPTINSTEDFAVIGPRITNVQTPSMPNINNSTVVTGQNFATDITATFTGTDLVARNAKSLVRSSSTSLIITRPDDMPPSANPYTLTLTNPGAIVPTSSNSHKSINTISAGNSPVWVTTSPISYDFGVSWNGGNLSATDADGGSSVTYSVVSGSLPTGISLSSNGTLSGTPSSSQISATVRATDSGGNFIDRTFLFNKKPVWNTTSLPQATQNVAYSTTLSASDDVSISSYTLVSGALPAGLSLNTSSGVISGTPTNGNGNAVMTFRATDSDNVFVDKNLSIGVTIVNVYTSNTTFTVPSGVSSLQVAIAGGGGGGGSNNTTIAAGAGGGGGGGLVYNSSLSVSAGQQYAITIGGGGTGATNSSSAGSSGSSSTWGGSITANGGGYGGAGGTQSTGAGNGGSGGSGGGGGGYNGGGTSSTTTRNTGGGSNQGSYSGWTSYGNAGSDNANQNATNSAGGVVTYGWPGGGGGGAGGAGGRAGVNGGYYQAGGAGGAVVTLFGYDLCGGGGGGGEFALPAAPTNAGYGGSYSQAGGDAASNRGGGGGGAGRNEYNTAIERGGNGGSGVVIVAYSA